MLILICSDSTLDVTNYPYATLDFSTGTEILLDSVPIENTTHWANLNTDLSVVVSKNLTLVGSKDTLGVDQKSYTFYRAPVGSPFEKVYLTTPATPSPSYEIEITRVDSYTLVKFANFENLIYFVQTRMAGRCNIFAEHNRQRDCSIYGSSREVYVYNGLELSVDIFSCVASPIEVLPMPFYDSTNLHSPDPVPAVVESSGKSVSISLEASDGTTQSVVNIDAITYLLTFPKKGTYLIRVINEPAVAGALEIQDTFYKVIVC